jgi:CPA2 family monovalent cation:H+ antiporter-2
MSPHAFLEQALVVLGGSVLVLVLCHRLRIPPVVGLLLTGVLIGPTGLRLIPETAGVELFAEIGVVLLLFTIGLELSLERLGRARRALLIGGPAQAALTIAATFLIALALRFDWRAALFLGFVIALSSTAVVLKLYHDRHEIYAPHGEVALGILLFQDLLVVPMLVLVPILAGVQGGGSDGWMIRLVGGGVVLAAALFLARVLLPKVLFHLAHTRVREIFVLSALLLCLGLAYATEALGLSLALGAFLAGVVVAESDVNHQIRADIGPFRDVFTSLFFVSIGMLVDLQYVLAHLSLLLALTLGIAILKAVATGGAVLLLGFPVRIAALVGLGLAQIGEFSFLLMGQAQAAGLLASDTFRTLLAVTAFSMILTPAWIRMAPWIAERWPGAAGPKPDNVALTSELRDHVVIVGFGLAGELLARVLEETRISWVAIELNPETVRRAHEQNRAILYGDAARHEILELAAVERAKVLVFVISDYGAIVPALHVARALNPDLHIIVRTRRVSEIEGLRRAGADQVIALELETAIEIFSRVLHQYHVPRNVIRAQTRLLRGEGYQMLRAPSLTEGISQTLLAALDAGTTEVFRIPPESPAAGKSLRQLDLRRRTGASVIAVVCDGTPHPNPEPELVLEVGNDLVLVGSHAQIDRTFEALAPPAEEFAAAAPSL